MLGRSRQIHLLLLPGDGIGPEIMEEVRKVIYWLEDHTPLSFRIDEGMIGGAAYNAYGSPFPLETRAKVRAADAILLGAVGGPEWQMLDVDYMPERGVIALKQELELFAEVRPCFTFPHLDGLSPLKPKFSKNLKLTVVRDLQGGVYCGEPRGIEPLFHGGERGFNTLSYSSEEVSRIAHAAFKIAQRSARKELCSIDQADLLESMQVWRKVVSAVAKNYPDVSLTHMVLGDAFQAITYAPERFDVLLLPNMVGDIMSNLAAGLTGSQNLMATAAVGEREDGTTPPALYKPMHGSVAHIAGQGVANPVAMLLSFVMCLKHSLNEPLIAEGLLNAMEAVLETTRTADIMEKDCALVGTAEMGDAIVRKLGNFIQDI